MAAQYSQIDPPVAIAEMAIQKNLARPFNDETAVRLREAFGVNNGPPATHIKSVSFGKSLSGVAGR